MADKVEQINHTNKSQNAGRRYLSLIGGFILDQLLFTVIYVLAFAMIISFYQMSTQEIEYVYPALIAAFFYLIYLFIQSVRYLVHIRHLERLKHNAVTVHSSVREHRLAYDAIYQIYHRFQDQLAGMRLNQMENKRLISAFVHNMKTPVTVSSLLIQRAHNQEITQEEALTGVNKELHRVSENLNQLLELQRVTELERDYEPKSVNLAEEVRRVINQNKQLFINSHVYPKVEMEDETLSVLTDPKWNSVVLQQLISNAVKYSRCQENRSIFFSAKQEKDHTYLMIQDQGIGIPEYDLPKVFDAYFTGTNGREGYNSSGIGLYLCKQICDRLGQEIHIENHDGCKVTITYLSKL